MKTAEWKPSYFVNFLLLGMCGNQPDREHANIYVADISAAIVARQRPSQALTRYMRRSFTIGGGYHERCKRPNSPVRILSLFHMLGRFTPSLQIHHHAARFTGLEGLYYGLFNGPGTIFVSLR